MLALLFTSSEKHLLFSSRIESLMKSLPLAEFCYSPLARLECLVMPFRANYLQLQKFYKMFFNAQTILTMPPTVFDQAVTLRANFAGLKTPDAPHIATALYHKCDEFWTNDNRLDKIKPNLVKNILKT